MPYADPDKRRQDDRERKRRARGAAQVVEDVASLPEPPSRDELLRILGAQARQGNTAAVRLLLEEYRRDGDNEATTPPRSVIDELASRRAS